MTDTKERINITLGTDSIDALQDLSNATGRSKSALLDEMIRTAIPTLKATTELLRKAQYIKHQAQQVIAHDFDTARKNAETVQRILHAEIYKLDTKINRNSNKKRSNITPTTNRG
jgi:predicted DNA-binding protein